MFLDKISIYGTATKLVSEPEIHHYRNAAYIPRNSGIDSVGLYDSGRKLILYSSYSRGPDLFQSMSPMTLACHYEDIKLKIPGTYIYVGDIHSHYGHFLLSTMSRFWPHHIFMSDLPILYLDRVGGDENWNLPHIRQILEAAGIDKRRFVKYDEPCIVENIILPYPAFEEGNFVHQNYGSMCRRFSDKFSENWSSPDETRPIYISKLRLKFGVRSFENEDEICSNFENLGFEVVYPEALSLGQQFSIWKSGRTIVSFTGSAHHSQVFANSPRLITINIGEMIPSTFMMCDWVSGSDSRYISVAEPFVTTRAGGYDEIRQSGFSALMKLSNSKAICEEVARAYEGRSRHISQVVR